MQRGQPSTGLGLFVPAAAMLCLSTHLRQHGAKRVGKQRQLMTTERPLSFFLFIPPAAAAIVRNSIGWL